MKKSLSPGQITAIVIGVFVYFILLVISFVMSIYFWGYVLVPDREKETTYTEESDMEEDILPYEWESEIEEDTEEVYYEFGNALRDDLSYQVNFETLSREFVSENEEGKAVVEFVYPVVAGDIDNIEAINKTIKKEVEDVESFVETTLPHLAKEEVYLYTAESYATYMSENLLSLIMVEYAYLDDEFVESYVKCFNIDTQTGMILKNTQMLEIDDTFSVVFRKKCEKQNGEISSLSYFMDQDITEYLTREETLIIFYTPLGMEVGFNYEEGWVTVTYTDYERYKKQF